ncbi:hypothetical protein NP233_g1779 [Leucocoprinus birnbaumii]|uniref:Acyl-CoA desaturase n=1 Tax=Leucocoprinus birnbaumii TaxID=56174 RepID=A0AAD5VZH8_9AGAR|nr:hypothetical protein NP233_g1779 [Leucocoprinus birnbaumii]
MAPAADGESCLKQRLDISSSSDHSTTPQLQDDYPPQDAQWAMLRPVAKWRAWYNDINKSNCAVLILTHGVGLLGPIFITCQWKTLLFALSYAYLLGFGITAGYHRLWSHRSYNASLPLQYFLAVLGAGAVQYDIQWWCRQHRAHHRYTDTELDPYGAPRGFWYSHIGWLIFVNRQKIGFADISDLRNDPVVQWQRRNFVLLALFVAFVIPGSIPYWLWNETISGCIVYAIAFRICYLHHVTFSVNSLAHWLGEATYDDKDTPRDHFLTALVTLGEGYHNFHHQFPMDYRNAIKWYQYDPSKWFIWVCEKLGFADNLKVCADNEIRKSEYTMQLNSLREKQGSIIWPVRTCNLPVLDWDAFQTLSQRQALIIVAGFIHDVTSFINEHPGGSAILISNVGQDATAAFFGGIYSHSNAAHNLLAMKRVGILQGGFQPGLGMDKAIPPSQRLRIMQWEEIVEKEL